MTKVPQLPEGAVLIENVPGHCVTREGKVYSCLNNRWGIGNKWVERKCKVGKRGYPAFSATVGGKLKMMTVHRVVAIAFIGPCPEGHEVCHNDGNRLNCRADNLRWGTRADNMRDKDAHGTNLKGERHPKSKVTDDQYREILALIAEKTLTRKEIANKFGISHWTVTEYARKKSAGNRTRTLKEKRPCLSEVAQT